MDEKSKTENKNKSIAVIAIVIVIVFVIAVVVINAGSNGENKNLSSAGNTDQSSINQQVEPQYSQHASDYIYSYVSALSSLYKSTESFSRAQSLFGTDQSNTDIVVLTSMSEAISDLGDAALYLSPYLKDNDEAIRSTATLLYADMTQEINTLSGMKSSFSSAIANQDINAIQSIQTKIADFVSEKYTLENDVTKSMQIIKYIIENPTENPHPTGPVDYAISPDNRAYLLSQISSLFPQPLDHAAAQGDIYLFWPRIISVLLSVDTYEGRAAVQL